MNISAVRRPSHHHMKQKFSGTPLHLLVFFANSQWPDCRHPSGPANETVTTWYKSMNNQWKSSMCGRICKNNPCDWDFVRFMSTLDFEYQWRSWNRRAGKSLAFHLELLSIFLADHMQLEHWGCYQEPRPGQLSLFKDCVHKGKIKQTWRFNKEARVVEASYSTFQNDFHRQVMLAQLSRLKLAALITAFSVWCSLKLYIRTMKVWLYSSCCKAWYK